MSAEPVPAPDLEPEETPAGRSAPTILDDRERAYYRFLFFQEFLQELRISRQREDILTFGFASVLTLLIAVSVIVPDKPALLVRLLGAGGLVALAWRVNSFLSDNRNRQNSIKKVITATEHHYPFPDDRKFIRLPDFKNLDGPGDWDRSDYSLADWDRSEYSVFLKILLVAAVAVILFL